MINDPLDDRPLSQRLHLIERELPDSPTPAKSFFQDWPNMPDSDIGTMLMFGSVLCLAVGFALQFIKGNRDIILSRKSWEIIFPENSFLFAVIYYLGLLMTIRETQVFGLYEHFKYFVAITAFGLICAITLGLFCIPLLKFIFRLYDSVLNFKEELLLMLVREYGFPQNTKELVKLFGKVAKEHVPHLYASVRTLYKLLIEKLEELSIHSSVCAKTAIKRVGERWIQRG